MVVTVIARGVSWLPPEPETVEVAVDSTLEDLLRALVAAQVEAPTHSSGEIPTNLIVVHNGRYVPASRLGTQSLSADDEVTIIPLVVGG